MPPKARGAIHIAPGTRQQTQAQRPSSITSPSGFRFPGVPPRVRISHACDRCRELRAKCTGGCPCSKCTKDDASCYYSDRKRERTKKSLERSANEISDLSDDKLRLVDALTSIIQDSDFDSAKHPQLVRLLEDMTRSERDSVASSSTQSQPLGTRSTERSKAESMELDDSATTPDAGTYGERLVRSDVGSPDRRRELTGAVDLDAGIGMPGYVGKMANIAWLQRIGEYLNGDTTQLHFDLGDSELGDPSLDTGVNHSYWADDENLLGVDEDYVDPHHMPSFQVANVLTETYFAATQGAFRFVERPTVLLDLHDLYVKIETGHVPTWTRRRQLALFNIMWAVAAKWLLLTGLDTSGLGDDGVSAGFDHHTVYYARARSLGVDHRIQVDHPNFEILQSMSILGFYLLINGSVHRAWGVIGQTIRHSTALGLHLKVANGALPADHQVHRARIWWSLYRLEIILSEMTGRPKCLRESEITVPLSSLSAPGESRGRGSPSYELINSFMTSTMNIPGAFTGGNVTWNSFAARSFEISGKYFSLALELSRISDKIASILYLSPVDLTWADVQSSLRELEDDVSAWQGDLASHLSVTKQQRGLDPRSALELRLNLFSVQMILYRPFLCEINITEESAESHSLNQRCARACVHAAMQLINHLPSNPVPRQVSLILPWWRLLHYTTQVIAIIVLEMCLNLQHMLDNEKYEVMTALKKALSYLWAFAPETKSAYRAWCLCRAMVGKAFDECDLGKGSENCSLEDVPQEATRPAELTEEDERWVEDAERAFAR